MPRPALSPAAPLPAKEFRRRHLGLLALLAAHVVALPLFGLLEHWSLGTGLLLDAPIVGFGLLAVCPMLGRVTQACCAVLGLLCCSAVLVWLWHGQTEAHFHSFVVVGAVALYEAWLPYLIAVCFVIVQHGAMGAWLSDRVFDGMDHMDQPWKWAAIHGGFIAALAIANLTSWRASSRTREPRGASGRAGPAQRAALRARLRGCAQRHGPGRGRRHDPGGQRRGRALRADERRAAARHLLDRAAGAG